MAKDDGQPLQEGRFVRFVSTMGGSSCSIGALVIAVISMMAHVTNAYSNAAAAAAAAEDRQLIRMAIGAIVLIAGVLGIRCSSWMLGVLWYPLQLLWYPLQILVAAVISLVAAAWGAMVSGRRCQDHDQRAPIPEAASQDNPKEVIRMYGEWMNGMNEVQEQLLDFKLKEKLKKAENRMQIKALEDPGGPDQAAGQPPPAPPASQQPPASQRRTPPEYVPLAPTDHPTRGGLKL